MWVSEREAENRHDRFIELAHEAVPDSGRTRPSPRNSARVPEIQPRQLSWATIIVTNAISRLPARTGPAQ